MDNNRNNLNKREVFMGHAYVFLFFIITTVICCISIFMWNSDFSMFEQKEFVKVKMNRIKDYQQEQADHQVSVDSLFRKIEKFEPGVYAQYEDLFFIITTVICCISIFMWNSDFSMFEQKEFVKVKMNRIKDYQQEQADHQVSVDSLFRKIEKFEPGVYAQYEEDDIRYLINNLKNTYEKNNWDKRYKLFMHIADFYDMWLSDKKQLWSIQQNIITFKANLEECEIGLQKKLEDLRSGSKK